MRGSFLYSHIIDLDVRIKFEHDRMSWGGVP